MSTEDDELPKLLDISLITGSSVRIPRATRFNKLRELLLDKCGDTCWLCIKFDSCKTVDKIFECSQVKHITKHLKKEDYYEKT